MEQFETDEQRAEAFKQWLAKYTGVIILGLMVGFGIIYYQQYNLRKIQTTAADRGAIFNQMLTSLEQGNLQTTQQLIDTLKETPQSSGYWGLATLQQAELAFEAKQAEGSIQALNNVSVAPLGQGFNALAKYRLAQLYFDQQKYEQALNVLNTISETGFQGLRKELEGDLHLAQHQTKLALDAFNQAYQAGGASPLLALKRLNLGAE